MSKIDRIPWSHEKAWCLLFENDKNQIETNVILAAKNYPLIFVNGYLSNSNYHLLEIVTKYRLPVNILKS